MQGKIHESVVFAVMEYESSQHIQNKVHLYTDNFLRITMHESWRNVYTWRWTAIISDPIRYVVPKIKKGIDFQSVKVNGSSLPIVAFLIYTRSKCSFELLQISKGGKI